MPHAAGVKKALKQLDFLPAKEPLFVTDAGFYAPEIIVKYTMSGMHFQTGVPLEGAPWIKDAVTENIDRLLFLLQNRKPLRRNLSAPLFPEPECRGSPDGKNS